MEEEAIESGRKYKNWKEQENEFARGLEYIRQNMKKKRADIVINSAPKDVIQWFIELADKEFNGHRGFALKWLKDMYIPESQMLWNKLEEFESRLQALESKGREVKKKIRMLDGRQLKCT